MLYYNNNNVIYQRKMYNNEYCEAFCKEVFI